MQVATPLIVSFFPDSNIVGDGITNSDRLTLSGTAVANSLVELFDGTSLLGTVYADSTGAWSFATPTLADGTHTFTGTDTVAGNTSQASPSLNVTVDTLEPGAPIAQWISSDQLFGWEMASPLLTNGGPIIAVDKTNSVTLAGTAEANSTVAIYDGATKIGTVLADSWGAWSYTSSALTAGSHGFWETDTDAAGNTSAASSVSNVTVNTLVTLEADYANYENIAGTYSVTNNPWNRGTLVNGIDYTNTITFDPKTFPDGINFSWSWPSPTNGSVRAYPSVIYAPHDTSGNPILAQVGNLINLTTNYAVNISGDTGGFNVSFDIWLRDKPNGTILDELMVWVHSPTTPLQPNQPYTVTAPGLTNASVCIGPCSLPGFNGDHAWTYIGLDSPVDLLSNQISLSDVFKTLIWEEVLTGNEFISEVQFGSEVQAGTGGLNINSLSYTWTANPSQLGTAGNDTFAITSMGGNNVIGNGGVDTVVYAGSHSNYQIKSSGSEIIITEGNNISTLDELQGITFIRFSDGTYDIATAKFTPNAPVISSFSPDSGMVGDGITNATTLTLIGTAVANSTVTIYDGTTQLGTATANASGAWSFAAAHLADATHSFTATDTDAASNTRVALAVTVDTVAPNAPVIVSDAIINMNEVMLTGTAEANSTVNVFEGTTQLGTATADGSGAWSFTTGQLSSGDHAFTATATDAAGNTSLASQPIDPTIDPAAPPSIVAFSPDSGTVGDGITNANKLTLTGTAVANSTVNIYDGMTLLGTAASNGSGAWSFTTATLVNGSHSFTATDMMSGATSAASAALAVIMDTVAPAVTDHLASDTGSSSIDMITSNDMLTGSGDPNAVAHFTVDGTPIAGTATANSSGVWTFAPTGLADGHHTIVASETDAAGNTGTASLTFTLDTKAPVVTESLAKDTGSSSTDKITSNDTLTGSGDPNAVVHFTVDGNLIAGTATANSSGVWTFTPTGLVNGTHTIMANETDAAGNTGTASLTFTFDTTAPTTTIADIVQKTANNVSTTTISGTSEAGSLVTLYEGNHVLGTATVANTGQWSISLNSLSNTVHNFTAAATDLAGNNGTHSQVAIFGSTGSDNIVGVAAGDIIVSSGGADKLTAGSGNDTFIFNPGFGKDTVSKFDLNHDVLAFDHTLFASVANVLSHAQNINGNAVITFDSGDTVTLVGIKTAHLLAHQNDIHII